MKIKKFRFLVKKSIKNYVKNNNKRITEKALIALDNKIENILKSAISLTKSYKTITDIEIIYSRANINNS